MKEQDTWSRTPSSTPPQADDEAEEEDEAEEAKAADKEESNVLISSGENKWKEENPALKHPIASSNVGCCLVDSGSVACWEKSLNASVGDESLNGSTSNIHQQQRSKPRQRQHQYWQRQQ